MEMRQLRHAPATLRNREAILEVLRRVLPARGLLLEIASGSGEHAAFMTPRLPELEWQPSDADPAALPDIDAHAQAASARIRPAMQLDVQERLWPVTGCDALLCCNMIHIAPWTAAEGLFVGAARVLLSGAPLILYGPFKRNGLHTAESNERFDTGLRLQDVRWGLRCLDTQVMPLAERNGFALQEVVPMPANNLTVVWRRT